MRLIDADNLKPDTKTFTSAYSEELTEFYSQEVIDNAPTVEAEPVRHGHWERFRCKGDRSDTFHCSECKYLLHYVSKFCPNCGAKMDRKAICE